MVVINSILIVAMVVMLVMAVVRELVDTKTLKDNVGTVVGYVIWLLVVVAIGFQELPWLKALIEKKS